MQTNATQPSSISLPQAEISTSRPWLMLFSRSGLFLAFQLLITLILITFGVKSAWDESARYWALIAALANIGSIILLISVYSAEGKRYLHAIRFSRQTWKADVLWFIVFNIVAMPFVAIVMQPLAVLLFGDAMTPTNMMFLPLPTWVFILSFLFPLTIGFAELPTYFGYCMPRLAVQLKNGWLAWLIASFFLAAQHMFLPLILDGRFMLWRLGMFAPFALITGLAIKLRPTLLPYCLVGHALIDITTLLVYLSL